VPTLKENTLVQSLPDVLRVVEPSVGMRLIIILPRAARKDQQASPLKMAGVYQTCRLLISRRGGEVFHTKTGAVLERYYLGRNN
jgi:hypothetical protein